MNKHLPTACPGVSGRRCRSRHLAGRGWSNVYGDGHVHVRADGIGHRDVPRRVRPGSRHGGGQRRVQHVGRAGVCGPGGRPSRLDRRMAAVPGQRRLRDVHSRAGRHCRRQRGRVVRGARHGRHVRRLLLFPVRTGQARQQAGR